MLKKEERQVLLKKYMMKYNLDFYEAREKVNTFTDKLRDIKDNLKVKNKAKKFIDEEIQKHFVDEFRKLE